MRLHLVDTEPDLVEAWKQAFAPFPEVEVVYGNILEVANDTLVSPANSYGYMDGGIDRLYIEHFGLDLQRRVTEAIAGRPEGCLPVGASLLVSTGNTRIPYLIVAPTMTLPEPVPAAHAFRAMAAALRIAKQYSDRISDIYCPGLTTGIGRVPFADAAREMAAAYAKWVQAEASM